MIADALSVTSLVRCLSLITDFGNLLLARVYLLLRKKDRLRRISWMNTFRDMADSLCVEAFSMGCMRIPQTNCKVDIGTKHARYSQMAW